MNFKKFMSIICSFTMLVSSMSYCKAENYSYKICIIGDERVGKTQICESLKGNPFTENYEPTVGASFSSIICPRNNNIQCNIWDTSGQLKFAPLLPLYLKYSQSIIFVCDATKTKNENIDRLNYFFDSVTKCIPDIIPNCLIVLNKCDARINDTVSIEELSAWAREHGFEKPEQSVIEYSAKNRMTNNPLRQKIIKLAEQTETEQTEAEQAAAEQTEAKNNQIKKTGLITAGTTFSAYITYKIYQKFRINKNVPIESYN